jgi:uncharacterized protein
MIIGLLAIGGCIALIESIRNLWLEGKPENPESVNLILSLLEIIFSVRVYILLYDNLEKRRITELSSSLFLKYSVAGFMLGLIIQSLAILIIYWRKGYSIELVNSFLFMLPAVERALMAGFVAELIFTGIIFRLAEEWLGTWIALAMLTVLFALAHIGVKGANLLSVSTTAIQSGILLSSAFVFSRSLWIPIFLHFGWDLAEPGIWGGINPGIKISNKLFNSHISGSEMLTGGAFGPGNSLTALILSLVTAILFLSIARKKNRIIPPYWKRFSP